jgi:hypothetical protein
MINQAASAMARTATKAAPMPRPALAPTESSFEEVWFSGLVGALVVFVATDGDSVALTTFDPPFVVVALAVFDPPDVGDAVAVVVIVLGWLDLAWVLVIVTGNSDVVKYRSPERKSAGPASKIWLESLQQVIPAKLSR